jgi:hypothetical protein
MDAVTAGWLPEHARTLPPFERAGDFPRETAGLDGAAFVERVRATYARRGRIRFDMGQRGSPHAEWANTNPLAGGRAHPGGLRAGLRAYGPAVFGRRWLKLPARVADSETMIRCPHPPEPHLQRGPAFTS